MSHPSLGQGFRTAAGLYSGFIAVAGAEFITKPLESTSWASLAQDSLWCVAEQWSCFRAVARALKGKRWPHNAPFAAQALSPSLGSKGLQLGFHGPGDPQLLPGPALHLNSPHPCPRSEVPLQRWDLLPFRRSWGNKARRTVPTGGIKEAETPFGAGGSLDSTHHCVSHTLALASSLPHYL